VSIEIWVLTRGIFKIFGSIKRKVFMATLFHNLIAARVSKIE